MGILRKVLSKMASPLDRYVRRRVGIAVEKKMKAVWDGAGTIKWKVEQMPSNTERMIYSISPMPKQMLHFEVHLADHCNLNCQGCDNFSPVAKEELLDADEYERDCKRLSELFGGEIGGIMLLGGEPLLNPDITKFVRLSRQYFPRAGSLDTKLWKNTTATFGIYIVTNGLLLPKMGEDFWDACRECNVAIRPTKYPIAFDYDAMKRKAKEKGVSYEYFDGGECVKTSQHYCIDIEGKQPIMHNFLKCHRANFCVQLRHGRLYTCSVAPNLPCFRDYFHLDMQLNEDDGIDIYKAASAEEIMDFLARPPYACRYCNYDATTFDLPWAQSQKSIKEWT